MSDRAATMRLCVFCGAAALLLLPLAARSAFAPPPEGSMPEELAQPVTFDDPWHAREVEIVRDPFALPKAKARPKLQTVVVRAVVVGSTGRALIEIGNQTRIVGIGDNVGGLWVKQIEPQRLLLSDGTILRVQQAKP